jgi:toxin YoeB
MAKKIVWSALAAHKRKKILQYWITRNKSKTYSIKLNTLFREAELLILDYPLIGKPTNEPSVRFKVIRNYLLFYEITEAEIRILTIWDSRQDPDQLTFNKT